MQLHHALECKEAEKQHFGKEMRGWVKHLHEHPPAGSKCIAICWPHSRRCSVLIIFETDSHARRYQDNEWAQLAKAMSQFSEKSAEAEMCETGKVWKSSSRKEMEDGMNYLRLWSYEVQDGKDWDMEQYWSKSFAKLTQDDPDWMMYSACRPRPGKWTLALSQRNASIVERYVYDEKQSVSSGPLSSIVKGPAIYDDFWILEGVSYPH